MSKKLKIPKNGLFGMPSSVRQTNNEENNSTQVPENFDTEEPGNLRTEEAKNSDISIKDTAADWEPLPITAVEVTSASEDPSTTIPKELDNLSQVLRNPSSEELSRHENKLLEDHDTEVLKNSDIEVSSNSSTQVLENLSTKKLNHPEDELLENQDIEILKNSDIEVPNNPSTQVLKYSSTELLKVQGTPVSEVSSANDSKYPDSWTLPKPQKNNRTKDDKKPVRKQASVHLTGAALKALHLYAYEEGLEKSEVVEKALRKFIPKRFF